MAKLLTPIKIKNITLKNRIVMSPMCQYSAQDGFANDWHFVHYGTRAVGGCGAIIVEATSIAPEGRISHGDLGIWKDEHIEPLANIVSFIEKQGAVSGIQLAHAGRKASFNLPWIGNDQIKEGPNSWQTLSPSPIPFHEKDMVPIELSKDNINKVISEFKVAASRAVKAGFKIIEIHAAHGYLVHQFLSPLSNHRMDEYGGVFENRIRFLLEIVDAIKTEITQDHSLWVRISATDWVDGGWNALEATELSKILEEHGVDLIDVSSGGNVPHADIPVAPNYQVPFAHKIKKEAGNMVGAVGLIITAKQAENLLEENKCDLVIIGRQLLRDPYFAINSAKELGEVIISPIQYERGYK